MSDEVDRIVDWQLSQERPPQGLPIDGERNALTEFSCGACHCDWSGSLDLYRCPECGAEAQCATSPAALAE